MAQEYERARCQCLNCKRYFWIELTEYIGSIPEGEAFEYQCPYCPARWAQFSKEEEKKTQD